MTGRRLQISVPPHYLSEGSLSLMIVFGLLDADDDDGSAEALGAGVCAAGFGVAAVAL